MIKLAKLIDTFYSIAMDKATFQELTSKDKTKQWAIISPETAQERSDKNENIDYFDRSKGEVKPVTVPLAKNKKKLKLMELEENPKWKMEELYAPEWEDPGTKVKSSEGSYLFYNISFEKAHDIAWSKKQESFIFKPWNGPIQLISTNPTYVKISKKEEHSQEPEKFFSTCVKDKCSFSFNFPEDSEGLNLPYYGKPYKWTDPEVIEFFDKIN